ncbi:MAG: GGDEF domain-containing protein [Treponema sp.]|nr:GGDEF domain-containing protein [Treponema sp.]MBR5033403.1 GGDEF domain-containing protein [Treponema sp.]
MSDYSKESVSDLLYKKVDSLIIVDAHNNTYKTVKKTGFFEKFIEDEGIYNDLIEKLWFHFANSSAKITEDYHVFVPTIGKFSGKYSNRISLVLDNEVHNVQISIYPLDAENTKYLFVLDELDKSDYVKEFLSDTKINTMQNTYLFSMYVDLIKNTTNSINVSEISSDSVNYDVSYTDWRMMIVNMIWPEDQNLFLERTDPEYLKKNLLPGRTSSFDCQMKNLEGVFIWVKLIFSRAITTNADDFRFVFMVQNIHDDFMNLNKTLRKYEELASKDPLTELFNHGRIETEIINAVELYKSKGEKVSLMMLDIDYFKKVNDKFGHAVGDIILKQFAKLVRTFLEPYDIKTGRWGGEEFVCVCYGKTFDEIKELAEKLRETIEQEDFEYIGKLTCSLGLTEIQNGDDSALIFDRVDKAMYDAKNGGRNCVMIQ